MSEKISESYEEYLEAIYRKSADRPTRTVKTSELAEELHVKPPSVTEMLDKLKSKGYIAYEKRKGVKLTKSGRLIAERVLKSHRIVEEFLQDILCMDQVHELACELEHHITPEMYEAINRFMRDKNFNLDVVKENIEEYTKKILDLTSDSKLREQVLQVRDEFIKNLLEKFEF